MQVLHRDDRQKKLSLLLGQDTLVLLERTPIREGEVDGLNGFVAEHSNSVYRWGRLNECTKAVVVSPADAQHICKYSRAGRTRRTVVESAQDYRDKVEPWMERQARTDWVDNIVEGRAEQERVYHQDADIVILPDSKWTGQEVDELYLLVLFKDPRLRSLRDVSDADLLRRVKATTAAVLRDKHDLRPDSVSMYFHYPPTYHRLHLHVVSNQMVEGVSSHVGLAHSIDTVLYHLHLDPHHYAQADIAMLIGPQHPLFN